MKKEKSKAISLRKEGFSYNEINKILGTSKSTLSFWLSDIKLSQKAKGRLAEKVHKGSLKGLLIRNKNQTFLAQERADQIRKEAAYEARKLSKNKLFIAGVSLYWAEGYKKGAHGSKWKAIDFANSDSELIKIIIKFFKKFLGIEDEKIKIQLIAHKNVDINKAVDYWSKITKIPKNQFIKSCCSVNKSSKNKRNPNSLTYGTVHIRINDVKLFFRIIGWIDGLKKSL